jgi:hypothetical protein
MQTQHQPEGIFVMDESDIEEELDLGKLSLEKQPSYYIAEELREMDVDSEIVPDPQRTFYSD